MPHDHEPTKSKDASTGSGFERDPLYSASRYIKRSKRAGAKSDACGKEFTASFKSLLEWGEKSSFIVDFEALPFGSKFPDACGGNLLVGDAHEGNVIETSDGKLVPIDLNLIQPTGDLLEWVKRSIL